MEKNTDINPNHHSPCVEPPSPNRISPEDLSYKNVMREDAPPGEKAPDKILFC